jgi:hypothetical protein
VVAEEKRKDCRMRFQAENTMVDRVAESTVVPITSATEAVNSASPASETAVENHGQSRRLASSDGAGKENRDTPRPCTIREIQVNKSDARGVPITQVYAIQSGEYAVYKAGDVMVAFADDPEKAATQRKLVLPLSTARAELNYLILGLKGRDVCDQQLAYALQLALDGDVDGAKTTIAGAKASVLARRAARGRFQYLKWSYVAAVILIALLFVAGRLHPFQEASSDLWLAAKGGLVGAAFSIALAIRGRTVALDTDLLDNLTDGMLRLLIGVISAGVLLLLLASGIFPSLEIGNAELGGSGLTWQMVLIIGFVGGFLERLVPDLLDKKSPPGNDSSAPTGASAPVAGQ